METLESIFADMESFVKTKADAADQSDTGKEFSRKNYRESDSSINARIEKQTDKVRFGEDWVADMKEEIASLQDGSNPELLQKVRVELDQANAYLAERKAELDQLKGRRERRDDKKPVVDKPQVGTPDRAKKRDDRHALTEALIASGKSDKEAYAIAYDIIEKGQFDKSKLPADIQKRYYP